jgi:hypothetical protein
MLLSIHAPLLLMGGKRIGKERACFVVARVNQRTYYDKSLITYEPVFLGICKTCSIQN